MKRPSQGTAVLKHGEGFGLLGSRWLRIKLAVELAPRVGINLVRQLVLKRLDLAETPLGQLPTLPNIQTFGDSLDELVHRYIFRGFVAENQPESLAQNLHLSSQINGAVSSIG